MSKGILGWTQQDVLAQFQNGKAAMMINGPWQIPVLREQSPDLKWEVSTLPKDKQGASILGGENYSIIKGGPNVDAAWDLSSGRSNRRTSSRTCPRPASCPAGRTWPKTPTGRAIRYWPSSSSN